LLDTHFTFYGKNVHFKMLLGSGGFAEPHPL